MRALFLSLFLWLIATTSAFATTSLSVDTGRVEASLLSSHYTVTPGQTFQIALKTELDQNWHTYWRNPGDSGEPVQITWILPDALSADDIVWPLPDTIPTGPIINYGFEGAPLFPVAFTVAENARSARSSRLRRRSITSFVMISAFPKTVRCGSFCKCPRRRI